MPQNLNLICPAVRSFVSETPYLAGQALAYTEYALEPLKNFYDVRIANTTSFKAVSSFLNAVLNLNLVTPTLAFLRDRAYKVAFVATPLVLLYQNAPHIFPEGAFNRLNTIAVPITTGLTAAIQVGNGLINKINSLLYAPCIFGFKTAFIGAKVAVIPTAAYFVSRFGYQIMCENYERNLKTDSTHKPLDFFENFSKGHFVTSLSLAKSPKERLQLSLRAAKNISQQAEIAEEYIDDSDLSACNKPYNHSSCFCGLTNTKPWRVNKILVDYHRKR